MILRALALGPMLAHPVRFAVTILGVAVGVASVVSTLLAGNAAVTLLGRDVDDVAGRERLELRGPAGVEVETLGALRDLAGEALFAPVVEDVALVASLGETVQVLGVDLLLESEMSGFELDPGERPRHEALERLLAEKGAIVPRALGDELGLTVGDPLELLVRSRRVELEVAAFLEPTRFAGAWDRVLLVDVACAQELYGRGLRVDRVDVLPRLDLDLDDLAARITTRLPAGVTVGTSSERREQGRRMVRALEFNLTALSGVSVLVGIVLVATTLATSVVQRRKWIALLRSLGASRAQIAGSIFVEAGVIGTLGGALGVLGGWLGSHAALAGVRLAVASLTPGVATGSIHFEARWALLGLAVGVLSSLLAALLPLREALRTPPVQGLSAEHPESVRERKWGGRLLLFGLLLAGAWGFAKLPAPEDRPIWALISALLLLSTLLVLSAPLIDLFAAWRPGPRRLSFGTPLRLAQAAVEAGRARAAWAAAAVGVALGLAVAMTTMVGSFRQTVIDWAEQALRSDLYIRPLAASTGVAAGRIDPEVVRIAREVFGEEAVDPFHSADAYVDGRLIKLGGAEFAVVAREGGVPFLSERDSKTVFAEAVRTGGVVVNEPFQERFGLGRGDRVRIDTPQGAVEREIVGVYYDYSGHTGRVVLNRPDFLNLYPDEGPQNIAIFLPRDADVAHARREFLAAVDGRFALAALPNRELREDVLAVFERTFAVTIALQLVASAVAGIAVITVLSALVYERRRELGVLRALGCSRRQLMSVVLGEALLLALAGALGGLLVGLLVGWVLVAVVNLQSFGWSLRFLPPWGSIAGTVGAVVPACLLAALPPALLSLRTPPVEALRETG